MSITVRFACGHEATVGVNVDTAPICPCGERQIVRTKARAPRFVGTCKGPFAETRFLEPGVVDVAPGGSLPLKEQQ